MKIFKLPLLAEASPSGEYTLTNTENKTQGKLNLVYRTLTADNEDSELTVDAGCEEIFFVLSGRIEIRTEKNSFAVSTGEAFIMNGPANFEVQNINDAESVFILIRKTDKNEESKENKDKDEEKPLQENSSTLGISQ
ncbi:MAG: hypothetical protein KAT46_03330 [Deltaproteobacteria bacterium]|nr:hypothetical protein [Deltaproteobacteria bacterium]